MTHDVCNKSDKLLLYLKMKRYVEHCEYNGMFLM